MHRCQVLVGCCGVEQVGGGPLLLVVVLLLLPLRLGRAVGVVQVVRLLLLPCTLWLTLSQVLDRTRTPQPQRGEC